MHRRLAAVALCAGLSVAIGAQDSAHLSGTWSVIPESDFLDGLAANKVVELTDNCPQLAGQSALPAIRYLAVNHFRRLTGESPLDAHAFAMPDAGDWQSQKYAMSFVFMALEQHLAGLARAVRGRLGDRRLRRGPLERSWVRDDDAPLKALQSLLSAPSLGASSYTGWNTVVADPGADCAGMSALQSALNMGGLKDAKRAESARLICETVLQAYARAAASFESTEKHDDFRNWKFEVRMAFHEGRWRREGRVVPSQVAFPPLANLQFLYGSTTNPYQTASGGLALVYALNVYQRLGGDVRGRFPWDVVVRIPARDKVAAMDVPVGELVARVVATVGSRLERDNWRDQGGPRSAYLVFTATRLFTACGMTEVIGRWKWHAVLSDECRDYMRAVNSGEDPGPNAYLGNMPSFVPLIVSRGVAPLFPRSDR